MKLEIAKALGGVTAIISDNFKSVELVGIGKAEVSYANLRPNSVIVNRIETNPFDVETNQKILDLMKENGLDTKAVKVKKDKAGKITKIGVSDLCGFQFGLTDEQKKEIAVAYNAVCERFYIDFFAGKISVKVSIVGCDWPHAVLSVGREKYEGVSMWNLAYPLLEEKFHIYEAHNWLPREKQVDGIDVTTDVLAEIVKVQRNKLAEDEKNAADYKRKNAELAALPDAQFIEAAFTDRIHVDEDGEFSDCPSFCDDCIWITVWKKDAPQDVRNSAASFDVIGKNKTYTYRLFSAETLKIFSSRHADEIKKARVELQE